MLKKNKVFIIAEIGSTHDGSIGNATNLIEEAAKCGADAVKFQTHIAKEETIKNAPNPPFFKLENRYEYLDRTSFNLQQLLFLKKIAKKNKIIFLSSPFSVKAVDLLKKLSLDYYKIPSGEITNHPLLKKINLLNKFVFLSTGMSNWRELDLAVNIFKNKKKLVIMQCTSIYPCPIKNSGINLIEEIRNRYGVNVGFSDHTIGSTASIAAVIKGAIVIEKHFTLSNRMYGSDAKHSMEPIEFKKFCRNIREAETIFKTKNKKNYSNYIKNMKKIFEKSIVLKRNLKKGTIIKYRYLDFKKPGHGISPIYYEKIIGLKIKSNMKKDEIVKFSNLKKL
jgi:N-acetylneuraminate synthase